MFNAEKSCREVVLSGYCPQPVVTMDEDETRCYYHRKLRAGLMDKADMSIPLEDDE